MRQPLREQPSQAKREELLEQYYIPHHQKLIEAVEESLFANDHCLIIDGQSFPALPLSYELNQSAFRPDFCLCTDELFTAEELVVRVEKELEGGGYSTARDQPFSGTVVPIKHFQKDRRVQSLMIEINRWLYLAEDYSVDSERSEMLVKILRRVGGVLEGD